MNSLDLIDLFVFHFFDESLLDIIRHVLRYVFRVKNLFCDPHVIDTQIGFIEKIYNLPFIPAFRAKRGTENWTRGQISKLSAQ